MTYRAGIIGTGGVAGMGIYGGSEDDIGADPEDASHAGGYRATDGIELAAIADVDAEALERFGRAWDVPEEHRYRGHEAMLEADELDVISVCTPSMLHREHVEDAVRLADPEVIWCEKPIACSVADGEAMVETCEDAGVELVINHSLRFQRQTQALRAEIADGLLGEVHSVVAGSSMELLRVGTHVVDLAVYLLEARAASVAGHVTGENEAADHLTDRRVDDAGGGGFVRTDDGTFVTFDGTAPRDATGFHARFTGSDGRLTTDVDGWRYWDGDGTERDPPSGGYADDHEQGFTNAAAHTVDLIEGTAENVSPGRQACYTLEILVGFYVSSATGGRVSVPLERPLRDVTITSW
ncbi:Gfo/Idh/MocA family oxidoreductase [Halobacteria archaeon AArc-m2/3/4]|uniref:Gfo/Idh/MocA family oxidoreductase n=1 Tax=Natronoglomus mannanivorans TaxID=2979990 RepID=A0ABT2QAQ9_9EURY|nr:Gfo/Idh/MocA family oxidoreductase [Halobacteria archaeon AArc-m2/3/4]